MENASKALILAGSILISIVIISLGVMIFRNMSGTVERNSNLTQQQIAAFNDKITPYLGENITGSQVNTLIQLVTSINTNSKNNQDTEKRVSIYKGEGNSAWYIKFTSTDTDISFGNPRKVETGKYYNVSGIFGGNGLITEIHVK